MTTHSVVRDEDQFCIYRSVEGQGTRVLWELTSACNLKCDFCLVEIKGRHVPVDAALAIADELVAARVDKVLLSGGEPLLYPGVEAVMRRLAAPASSSSSSPTAPSSTPGSSTYPGDPTRSRCPSACRQSTRRGRQIFRRRDTLAKIARHHRSPAQGPAQRDLRGEHAEPRRRRVGRRLGGGGGRACLSLTDIFKDPYSPARFRDDCRDLRIDEEQRR